MKKKKLENMIVNMFPSGFISYTETFFEVCGNLFNALNTQSGDFAPNPHIPFNSLAMSFVTKVHEIHLNSGRVILYDIAREITLAFEQANVGRDWDGEFYDEVDEFTINYILKNY